MASSNRKCKYHPNTFCYVCGFKIKGKCFPVSSDTKYGEAFEQYFRVKFEQDLDKNWAPNVICGRCRLKLLQWASGRLTALPFAIPRIWREQQNHVTDCYFCVTNLVTGKQKQIYPSLSSSIAPVPHDESLPVPIPPYQAPIESTSTSSEDDNQFLDTDFVCSTDDEVSTFTIDEFNKLVRDMKLSKRNSIHLAQTFKLKNLLPKTFKIMDIKYRDLPFRQYFSFDEGCCYCNNVNGLITELFGNYNHIDFLLFMDSSKSSFKAVLLDKKNLLPPVPIIYWRDGKETYDSCVKIFRLLNYKEHNWHICCDFKLLQILRGIVCKGNMKYPCLFCLYDNYDKNRYTIRNWNPRTNFVVGQFNVVNAPLISKHLISIPTLHIKLGLLKQFVRYMNHDTLAFKNIKDLFPKLVF